MSASAPKKQPAPKRKYMHAELGDPTGYYPFFKAGWGPKTYCQATIYTLAEQRESGCVGANHYQDYEPKRESDGSVSWSPVGPSRINKISAFPMNEPTAQLGTSTP